MNDAVSSMSNEVMQRLQAFKYELTPTGEQKRNLRGFAGSCRFVFNEALAAQKERYKQGGKRLSYVELAKLLTGWRKGRKTPRGRDVPWLKDAPAHPLQQIPQGSGTGLC